MKVLNDWQSDLEQLFVAVDARHADDDQPPRRPEVTAFFNEIVLPAFRELQEVLARHGRVAEVSSYVGDADLAVATLIVSKGKARKIAYSIRVDVYPSAVIPYSEARGWTRTGTTYAAKGTIRSGVQNYSVTDLTSEDIARNFVEHYTPLLRHLLDQAQA